MFHIVKAMSRSKKPHTTGDTSPNPAIEKRRLSPTLFFLAVILIPTGMLVTIALIGTDSSGPDLQPLVGRLGTDGRQLCSGNPQSLP